MITWVPVTKAPDTECVPVLEAASAFMVPSSGSWGSTEALESGVHRFLPGPSAAKRPEEAYSYGSSLHNLVTSPTRVHLPLPLTLRFLIQSFSPQPQGGKAGRRRRAAGVKDTGS